jgi:AmmeMemoRadiSam system protein A
MEKQIQNILLKTAREAIRSRLGCGSKDIISREKLPQILLANGASFVTLKKEGELRGCIGSLQAYRPLYDDVSANAVNSAFRDPRFPPVAKQELDGLKIEISVLSERTKIEYFDFEDIKKKIIPGTHGVYLTAGYNSATFLPQVWEQLYDHKDFFKHLCIKAGLPGDYLLKHKADIETYTVEHFEEE